jgi:xanthine/CO dehydrogenase XdhC/CoxF family maturation factor
VKDLQQILRRSRQLDQSGEPYVLATVVQVSGSAYRGPGTRMLIDANLESLGTISGGCLEGDVRQNARQVLSSGEPLLLFYDSTSEDDILWGTGLGCSGKVHVLLEKLPGQSDLHYPAFLAQCLDQRRFGVLATVFQTEGIQARSGQHLIVRQDFFSEDDLGDEGLREYVLQDARAELEKLQNALRPLGRPRHYELARGRASVLIEPVLPSLPLLILGAGYDAEPVSRLAAELGWHVSVVDHRPSYARVERFPEAQAVLLAEPGKLPQGLRLDQRTAVLLMTHNYLQDLALLRHLLTVPLSYLGILGPRKRTQRLLDDLHKEGIELTDEQAQRLFSPVGLDIGADTAEEIALSILGEIQCVLAGRSGGQLRDRSGPIHDRPGS